MRHRLLYGCLIFLNLFSLKAKEIPDYLGKGGGFFFLFPRKGIDFIKKGLKPLDKQKITEAEPGKEPLAKPSPPLMETLFEKRYSFCTEKWEAVGCWLEPGGGVSLPLPVWIDNNKDGHFFLKASALIGETQPDGGKKIVSLCQTLSLFHLDDGGILPIASPIWIVVKTAEGKEEETWTAEGGWEAAGPLYESRNVYCPFKEFLRHRQDALSKKLFQYEWPDILIQLHKVEKQEDRDWAESLQTIQLHFK